MPILFYTLGANRLPIKKAIKPISSEGTMAWKLKIAILKVVINT